MARPIRVLPPENLPPELVAFLTYGRGVDTTRMRTDLGFEPYYSTAEAFAEFIATLPPGGGRAERIRTGARYCRVSHPP